MTKLSGRFSIERLHKGCTLVILDCTSKDMFDVWFRIEGPVKPPDVAALGERIKIRGGPFPLRWAYFVAEIAGQAPIDIILGPAE